MAFRGKGSMGGMGGMGGGYMSRKGMAPMGNYC